MPLVYLFQHGFHFVRSLLSLIRNVLFWSRRPLDITEQPFLSAICRTTIEVCFSTVILMLNNHPSIFRLASSITAARYSQAVNETHSFSVNPSAKKSLLRGFSMIQQPWLKWFVPDGVADRVLALSKNIVFGLSSPEFSEFEFLKRPHQARMLKIC